MWCETPALRNNFCTAQVLSLGKDERETLAGCRGRVWGLRGVKRGGGGGGGGGYGSVGLRPAAGTALDWETLEPIPCTHTSVKYAAANPSCWGYCVYIRAQSVISLSPQWKCIGSIDVILISQRQILFVRKLWKNNYEWGGHTLHSAIWALLPNNGEFYLHKPWKIPVEIMSTRKTCTQ